MRGKTGWWILAACLALPNPARAQVGHDPAHSPYRTLRFGQFLGVIGGRFQGDGGALGMALHHGPTIGLRYDFLSSGTVTLGLAAHFTDLQRFVVNPTKPIERAVSGPFKQHAGIAEVILQFNLTGGKTWHHLAPYVSGAIGIMVGSNLQQDSSGFSFKTRFALTPGIGTRIFLNDRMFLRIEARSAFWSVSYPDTYRQVPSTAPSQPPVLATPAKEWLANAWYTVGISYAFSRPF